MKRFLCMLICSMLLASTAFAADEITLPEKFRHQFATKGNGLRGTASITASGVADWLDMLLPLTAAPINVRLIGVAQGEIEIPGDEEWQLKLYTEDDQDHERGVTYLYSDGHALYLMSELLPQNLLTLPMDDPGLPFNMLNGDFISTLIDIDPASVKNQAAGENDTFYDVLSRLMKVTPAEYETEWAPVLDKYFSELDMWLTGYGSAPVVSGSTGSMTMKSSYTIPVSDLKAMTKQIIGMILYDYELQELLAPHFTLEEQTLYLNPALSYYYEACIDMLPLSGNIVFEREMTARGENIGMSVSLPIPELPADLSAAAGKAAASLLQLPYENLLSGMERLTIRQSGEEASLTLSGALRSINVSVDESATNAETATYRGFLSINPAAGVNENPLSAAFEYKKSHTLWQDEDGAPRDDTAYSFRLEPDVSMLDADDPFRNSYIQFDPISIDLAMEYYSKSKANDKATQLKLICDALLPDASVSVTMMIRTTSPWVMIDLPVEAAETVKGMSSERAAQIATEFIGNVIQTVTSLNTMPQPTAAPENNAAPEQETSEIALPTVTEAPTETVTPAEPTAVPPMS